MNSIQARIRADFYSDLTRSARFTFQEYNIAFNDAIQQFIDEKLGDDDQRQPDNFQWVQTIRDDLYTLIKTGTPAITNGTVITNQYYSTTPSHIVFPTDYYTFVCLFVTVDGYTNFARPTSYNLKGPLLQDSFSYPTNKEMFYNEDSTGLTIYRGVGGTFSAVALDYIKTPAVFSIGSENQLLSAGTTLTNLLVYYATQVSVYNAVSYQPGDSITGTGAALTSGEAILSTNTTSMDVPERVQSDICKIASKILLSNIEMYQESQAVNSQISKQ